MTSKHVDLRQDVIHLKTFSGLRFGETFLLRAKKQIIYKGLTGKSLLIETKDEKLSQHAFSFYHDLCALNSIVLL